MTERLLVCTDLDRTLIPNGPQPESPNARKYFAALVSRVEVELSYVSGRHPALVQEAVAAYGLPVPDFVIGDVGTSLYRIERDGEWTPQTEWEEQIGKDWEGATGRDLKGFLSGIKALRLQESSKQGRFKLSYYAPLDADPDELVEEVRERLSEQGIRTSLIWSVDEPEGVGLLDVLPARASKYHAIAFLITQEGVDIEDTVFSGDSGNDLEPLTSPIPAVLVANAHPSVREQARRIANERGHPEQLYCAKGGFIGMNGNYSAGILEGIAHYHPIVRRWLDDATEAR
ncbi:MAG: HAD-IIB family hydrolase [Pseudomonadota bacterium]|nr:HAD-IIB family hydrolase [Pseudomonadota bacterium]